MKKRTLFVCLALVLVLLFGLGAQAATTGGAVAGFVQGEEVFAFFDLQDEDPDSLEVKLQLGDVVQSGSESKAAVVPFAESGLPVHYYILLDRSTSMPWHSDKVETFVATLLDSTAAETRTTLATFGDAFEVELAAAVDKDAVMKKLYSISYDEERTNLYKGINDALQDISAMQRTRGELVQVILITDGVPVDVSETPTPEEVQLRIECSPEVVFHTLMLGSDELLELGGGVHTYADGPITSGEAAEAIAGYAEELYTAAFKPASVPEEGRSGMKFIFTRGMEFCLTCNLNNVPVLGHSDAPDLTVSSVPETSESTPESATESDPESSEESSEPESSEESVSEPESSAEETPDDEETESAVTSVEEEAAPSVDLAGLFAGIQPGTWILIGVIAGVVVLLIIVLVVVLMILSRNKKRREAAKRLAPPPGAIMLRLEVLDGRCKRVRKPLFVAEELFIGRDMNGGIVWDEPDMAEKNTRLFVQDGVLYIEDLDSPQGTALGGMRIFAPNRLRSGEIISIGMVQFKLYF